MATREDRKKLPVMPVVKLSLENEIRRVNLDLPTVSNLFSLIQTTFPGLSSSNYVVKYLDDENELISLLLDSELLDALSQSKGTLKLFIYRKDSQGNCETASAVSHSLPSPIPSTPCSAPSSSLSVSPSTSILANLMQDNMSEVKKEVENEVQVLLESCDNANRGDVKELLKSLVESMIEGFLKALSELQRVYREIFLQKCVDFKTFVQEKSEAVKRELEKFKDSLRSLFARFAEKLQNSNNQSSKHESCEMGTVSEAVGTEDQPKTHDAQLEQLMEMGFLDQEKNLSLLSKYRGNINLVLQELLA